MNSFLSDSSVQNRIFFLNLRRFLINKGISVDDLFNSVIFLRVPLHISLAEFMKLVSMSETKLSTLETHEFFGQLKEGSHIPISKFIGIYQGVDQSHPL